MDITYTFYFSQLYTALSGVCDVKERVGDVKIKREELETNLLTSVPKWRSYLLTSVSVQTAPPLQQVYNIINIMCL